MWTIQFSTLFAVELKHEYFQGDSAEAFAMEPAPWTEPVLRRFGLLYRRTAAGFAVYADIIPGAPPRLRKPPGEGVRLDFLIYPSDPALLNYSSLPLDHIVDRTFFLTNRNEKFLDGKLLLSRDTTLSELDCLAVKPRRFPHSGVSAAQAAEIEILDGLGVSLRRVRVPVVDGTFQYGVDLGERLPGSYGIRTDGGPVVPFFALTTGVASVPFAVIEIDCGETVPASYRFVAAGGALSPKTYTLLVAARRTLWKYSVVLKYRRNLDPTGISLVSTIPAVTFTRQAGEVMADGTVVVPFLADDLIALRDRPYPGIKLTYGGNGSLEIDNLPNAAGSRLTLDPSGTKPCSEIFVYI